MNFIVEHDQLAVIITPATESEQQLVFKSYLEDFEKKKNLALKASRYYGILLGGIFIPTAFLITLASALSFIVGSDVLEPDVNKWMSITVGLIGILIQLSYSLVTGFKLQTKHDLFNQEHNDYEDLIQDVKFTQYIPNESLPTILDRLKSQTMKVQKRNKYIVPWIIYRQ